VIKGFGTMKILEVVCMVSALPCSREHWGGRREGLEVFLVDVRKEMKDTKIHSYFPL